MRLTTRPHSLTHSCTRMLQDLEDDVGENSEGMEDFIEDDEPGYRSSRRRGRKQRSTQGLSSAEATALEEVFGQFLEVLSGTHAAPKDAVADALQSVYGMALPVVGPQAALQSRRKAAPAERAEAASLHVPTDEELQAADVPERLYMRLWRRRQDLDGYLEALAALDEPAPEGWQGLHDPAYDTNKLLQPDAGTRQQECTWLAYRLYDEMKTSLDLDLADPVWDLLVQDKYFQYLNVSSGEETGPAGVVARTSDTQRLQALLETASCAIRLVLDECMEVPSVYQYRRDFFPSMIDQRLLWFILDHDELYWRVRCQAFSAAATLKVYLRITQDALEAIDADEAGGMRSEDLLAADRAVVESCSLQLQRAIGVLRNVTEMQQSASFDAELADARKLAVSAATRLRSQTFEHGSSTLAGILQALEAEQAKLDALSPEERKGQPDVLPSIGGAMTGKYDRFAHATKTGIAQLTDRLIPSEDSAELYRAALAQGTARNFPAGIDESGSHMEPVHTRSLPLEQALDAMRDQSGLSDELARKLLVSACAHELSANQQLRVVLHEYYSTAGCVSTECTRLGQQELTADHELYGLHVLRNKPFMAFSVEEQPQEPADVVKSANELLHERGSAGGAWAKRGLMDVEDDLELNAFAEAQAQRPELQAGEFPALGTFLLDCRMERAGLNCGYGSGAWFHRGIVFSGQIETLCRRRIGLPAMTQTGGASLPLYPQRYQAVPGRFDSRTGGPVQWTLLEKGERDGLFSVVLHVEQRPQVRSLTTDTRGRALGDLYEQVLMPACQLLPLILSDEGIQRIQPDFRPEEPFVRAVNISPEQQAQFRYDPERPAETLSFADTVRFDACIEACRKQLVPAELRQQRQRLRRQGHTALVEEFACALREQVSVAGMKRWPTQPCAALAQVFSGVPTGVDDVPASETRCTVLGIAFATTTLDSLAWAFLERDGRVAASGILPRSPRERQLQLAELIFTHAPDVVSIAAEGGLQNRFLAREVEFASVDAALLVMLARKSWQATQRVRKAGEAGDDSGAADPFMDSDLYVMDDAVPDAPLGGEADDDLIDLGAIKRSSKATRHSGGGGGARKAPSVFARGVFAEGGKLSHLSAVAKKWAVDSWRTRLPRHANFKFESPEWRMPPGANARADERFLASRDFLPFSVSNRHVRTSDSMYARLEHASVGDVPIVTWASPRIAQWARLAGDQLEPLQFPTDVSRAAVLHAFYTQSPLAAWCCMWPVMQGHEAAAVRGQGVMSAPQGAVLPVLHRYQSEAPASQLLVAAERVLCEVVAAVGVDVNMCIKHAHYMPLLQFVPGLGPVRALQLRAGARRFFARLADEDEAGPRRYFITRLELAEEAGLAELVLQNALGALRIPDPKLHAVISGAGEPSTLVDMQLLMVDGKFEDEAVATHAFARITPNPLDCTRIHPEAYPVVARALADIDAHNYHYAPSLRYRTFQAVCEDMFSGMSMPAVEPDVPATYVNLARVVMACCSASFEMWLRSSTAACMNQLGEYSMPNVRVDPATASLPVELYQPECLLDEHGLVMLPNDGVAAARMPERIDDVDVQLRNYLQQREGDAAVMSYYEMSESGLDSFPFQPVRGLPGGGRSIGLLKLMAFELWQPAREVRYPWEEPSRTALMYMLAPDVPLPGAPVQLVVKQVQPYKLNAETAEGLQVTLSADDVGATALDLNEQFSRGMSLTGTCVQVLPNEFAATCSLRSDPLLNMCPPLPRMDVYSDGATARILEAAAFTQNKSAAARVARGQTRVRTTASGKGFTMRHISHDSFLNGTVWQVMAKLADQPLYAAMLRPFHNDTDKLALTWKWQPDKYANYVVEETGDRADNVYGEYGLGEKLHFLGDTFESIDELIGRGIGAMTTYTTEAMQHRKFLQVSEAEVENQLRVLREEHPGRAAYFVHLHHDQPGCFCITSMLIAQDEHSPRKHVVAVRPAGLYFNKHYFQTITEVLAMWKQVARAQILREREQRADVDNSNLQSRWEQGEASASADVPAPYGDSGMQPADSDWNSYNTGGWGTGQPAAAAAAAAVDQSAYGGGSTSRWGAVASDNAGPQQYQQNPASTWSHF